LNNEYLRFACGGSFLKKTNSLIFRETISTANQSQKHRPELHQSLFASKNSLIKKSRSGLSGA
jgi:hypothetical protein